MLQYSFSETKQPKGYKIVEIKNQKITDKFIPLKPLRQLEVIEGNYEDAIQEKLEVKHKENYLHFKLTDEHLTTNQSKKIEKIMTALLEEGSK